MKFLLLLLTLLAGFGTALAESPSLGDQIGANTFLTQEERDILEPELARYCGLMGSKEGLFDILSRSKKLGCNGDCLSTSLAQVNKLMMEGQTEEIAVKQVLSAQTSVRTHSAAKKLDLEPEAFSRALKSYFESKNPRLGKAY